MEPTTKSKRWVIVAGALALIAGIAGFMIISRAGDGRQAAQVLTPAPAAPSAVPAAPAAAPAVTGAPSPGTLPSQPPPSVPDTDIVWSPRYDFALEVDGKPSQDACFYQESRSRRLLISAPDLKQVCILNQEGKQVTAIDRGKMKLEPGGEQVRLLPGAEGGPGSPYTIDQASVVFYIGPNRLKITAKQPLVGPASSEEILRHSPFYRKGMQEYLPSTADVAYLNSYPATIEIEVFFGTWCPHCKVVVPKFMKTMAQVENPNLRVSYHGVPTGFDSYVPAHEKGVVGIPTFIFTKNGKEVGRIPGDPGADTIEHAIAEILRGIRT